LFFVACIGLRIVNVDLEELREDVNYQKFLRDKQCKVLANEHDSLHKSSDLRKKRRNAEQLLSVVQLKRVHAEVDREEVWLQQCIRV